MCPRKPEKALDSPQLELQLGTEPRFSAIALCAHAPTEPSSGSCGFGLAIASNLLGKGKDSSVGLCEGDMLSFVRNSCLPGCLDDSACRLTDWQGPATPAWYLSSGVFRISSFLTSENLHSP